MISSTTFRSLCSTVDVSGLGFVRSARMVEKAGSNADSIKGNSTVWTISICSLSSIAADSASSKAGPSNRFLTGSQFILPDRTTPPSGAFDDGFACGDPVVTANAAPGDGNFVMFAIFNGVRCSKDRNNGGSAAQLAMEGQRQGK